MTKKELAHWRRRKKRIKALIAAGKTQAEVARIYRISKQRVSQIANA